MDLYYFLSLNSIRYEERHFVVEKWNHCPNCVQCTMCSLYSMVALYPKTIFEWNKLFLRLFFQYCYRWKLWNLSQFLFLGTKNIFVTLKIRKNNPEIANLELEGRGFLKTQIYVEWYIKTSILRYVSACLVGRFTNILYKEHIVQWTSFGNALNRINLFCVRTFLL